MKNGDLKRFYPDEPSSKTSEDFVRKEDMPTLEANPEGEATELLTKLSINNTIYALPSVNSDFSVANVSITIESGLTVNIPMAICYDIEGSLVGLVCLAELTGDGTAQELVIPLYKGSYFTATDDEVTIEVTGDIECVDNSLAITGDGTISITSTADADDSEG